MHELPPGACPGFDEHTQYHTRNAPGAYPGQMTKGGILLTISEAIGRTDGLLPNAYTAAEKLQWLALTVIVAALFLLNI